MTMFGETLSGASVVLTFSSGVDSTILIML